MISISLIHIKYWYNLQLEMDETCHYYFHWNYQIDWRHCSVVEPCYPSEIVDLLMIDILHDVFENLLHPTNTKINYIVIFKNSKLLTNFTANFRPPYSNWCIFSTARFASSIVRNSTELNKGPFSSLKISNLTHNPTIFHLVQILPYTSLLPLKYFSINRRFSLQSILPSVRNKSFNAAHLIS